MSTPDELQLAFRYHVTQALIRADGWLDGGEIAIYEAIISEMQAAGFMSELRELTDTYSDARSEALRTLKDVLDDGGKEALLKQLGTLIKSDGDVADAERATFDAAATALGVELEAAWGMLK